MVRFWSIARVEWRLAWRRPSFWLAQLPVLLLVLLPFTSAGPTDLRQTIAMLGPLLMLEAVVLPAAIAPSITRDLEAPGEVIWAAPLDALLHLLGLTAGLWLAVMPVLAGQLGLHWLVALIAGRAGSSLFWSYGLPMLGLGLTAWLIILVGLGLLLRRTLALALGAIALFVAILQLTAPARRDLLSLAGFYNILFGQMEPTLALGVGSYGPMVAAFALALVVCGLLALFCAAAMSLLRDRRRATRRAALLPALLLLAACAAAADGQLYAAAVAGVSSPLTPRDIGHDAWRVQELELRATVDVARSHIAGESTLRLVPLAPGQNDSVVLRLNAGMRLIEAADEAGQKLSVQTRGESVEIYLPTATGDAITLKLRWEGAPRLSYAELSWDWGARQVVRGLITPDAGYLLRDGDWYPWPWTAQPRLVENSRVTLAIPFDRVLATAPLQNGAASWQGPLPQVLVAIPPVRSLAQDGVTAYLGSLAGPEQLAYVRASAAAASRIWPALGTEPAPAQIVAVPYLTEYIWSGDLLLVPEVRYLQDPPYGEHSATNDVINAWWARMRPAPRKLLWVGASELNQEDTQGMPVRPSGKSDDLIGRWFEVEDVGGLTGATFKYAVSSWIALQVGSPAMQAAYLELYRNDPNWKTEPSARAVLALHEWSATLGVDRALRLAGEVLQTSTASDVQSLFAELEQRSGVPLPDL